MLAAGELCGKRGTFTTEVTEFTGKVGSETCLLNEWQKVPMLLMTGYQVLKDSERERFGSFAFWGCSSPATMLSIQRRGPASIDASRSSRIRQLPVRGHTLCEECRGCGSQAAGRALSPTGSLFRKRSLASPFRAITPTGSLLRRRCTGSQLRARISARETHAERPHDSTRLGVGAIAKAASLDACGSSQR